MSQLTKVKRDCFGLYVVAGGWISRPFAGTQFKEGDQVKSHHFGGSTKAGVTVPSNNFKRKGTYEVWSTTGTLYDEEKSWEERARSYEWYRKYNGWQLHKIPEPSDKVDISHLRHLK